MTGESTAKLGSVLREVSAAARRAGTPLVTHIVANGVRGDSRVIKSAETSAEQGFATVVIGIVPGRRYEVFTLGRVTVVLVPFNRQADRKELLRRWNALAAPLRRFRAAKAAGQLVRGRRPRSGGIPGTNRTEPIWAVLRPMALNMNVALGEALQALRPDLIHVQDIIPLPSAAVYLAGSHGRPAPRALYDAHEYIPRRSRTPKGVPAFLAMLAIEQEFIHDVDAVLTVSPQIASLLKKQYGLRDLPDVVTNAPSAVRDPDAPDLREVIGVSADTPLAVYAGSVNLERGIDLAVEALASLPDLHLAIVCSRFQPSLATVARLAKSLGVSDRLHFAPYVPPGQVTGYLSSADVGLIPHKAGAHFDLSLPTKYREFLHAGLPLVVSTNKVMAAEAKATGVGEVFRAGSVKDLVRALQVVLDDPEPYRRAATPELLREHSWEAQQEVLRRVYAGLSPRRPQPEETEDPVARLRTLQRTPAASGTPTTGPADPGLVAVSLGIGRANSAGQAYYWAEAARRQLQVSAESFAGTHEIVHPPHRVVERPQMEPPTAINELQRIVGSYTHLLIDGYQNVFGPLLGDDIGPEIDLLRRHGMTLGLIAHGTDVRDPYAHRDRLPHSYFHHVPVDWMDRLARRAERNREIAAEFDGPLFVSTPGTLHDLPTATWLPLVIDIDRWTGLRPIDPNRKLRVMHRPSRAKPPIKGTDVIVPVLEELDRRGVIEYLVDQGRVPAHEMPALVEQADVVVDSVRGGSYGGAAIEAMAAGRVVVASLGQEVHDLIGDRVPIVDARPETLAQVLTNLAENPDAVAEIAEQGRAFATRWHSGVASAKVIAEFLSD